jgi:diacylglycerol kinase family enzyme
MSSAILIANPAASQFTGGLHRSTMRALDKRHDVTAAWPTSSLESEELAAEAVANGTEIVVAMGGDGVVHHVAQGLVNTSAILGIVPVGTTNVLARILGAPSRPKKAVKILSKGFDVKRVPTLAIRGHSYHTEFSRSALFSLGVGPDAAVVHAAEQDPHRKRSFGSIHYARTALNTIRSDLRKRPPAVQITAGDRTLNGIGLLAQFHDVYSYFGKKPLVIGTPDPIALLVVEKLTMRMIPSVLNGARASKSMASVNGLTLWEDVASFSVSADTPVELQADGEVLAAITDLEVTHQPESLTVAVSTIP